MSTVARRMAIWDTLCNRWKVKMKELADAHGVTTMTIRLNVDCLSLIHPIETVCGRYDGCIKPAK